MISVEHVVKTYREPTRRGKLWDMIFGSRRRRVAVDDMSFEIDEPGCVGYLGPNGSGKTTTIKMLAGILAPDRGRISVSGLTPHRDRKANALQIGFVFGQRPQLHSDITLRESYSLLRVLYRVPPKRFADNLPYLTERLGIVDLLDRLPRTMSLGERMRAELAGALLHSPKLLYLDEPTIGLDLLAKHEIRGLIAELSRQRETIVILTTHDVRDVEELCDRIILIARGRKVFDGSMAKFRLGATERFAIDVEGLADSAPVDLPGLLSVNRNRDGSVRLCFSRVAMAEAQALTHVSALAGARHARIAQLDLEHVIRDYYLSDSRDLGPPS